jgi:hypothetical protein
MFRFLGQHHLPGLTLYEPRDVSVYAFSMEATEPSERLAWRFKHGAPKFL